MRLEDFDNDEDKIIQDKLKQKTWEEIRTNDSWGIFKIMAEFVNGYESMGRIGPCVTIFGSARTKSYEPIYIFLKCFGQHPAATPAVANFYPSRQIPASREGIAYRTTADFYPANMTLPARSGMNLVIGFHR